MPPRSRPEPLNLLHEMQRELQFVKKGDVGSRDRPIARDELLSQEMEDAFNKQISHHFASGYQYDAMAAYFDRDNVGLPGACLFHKCIALVERNDAYKLMALLNKRGGRVELLQLPEPEHEFFTSAEGDLLHAMEMNLAFARLHFTKCQGLAQIAKNANDAHVAGELASFLDQQSEKICMYSKYVSELRRIGKQGEGLYHFDRRLAWESQEILLAAAVEAISPPGFQEGTMARAKKRKSDKMDDDLFKDDNTIRKVLARTGGI